MALNRGKTILWVLLAAVLSGGAWVYWFVSSQPFAMATTGAGKPRSIPVSTAPAPDMRERQTQDLTDGQIFCIIKNGIRFAGMPGWGGEDEENWKLVLFIRHLPTLTAREIELMNEVNGLEKEGGSEKTSTPEHEQIKSHGHWIPAGRIGSETLCLKKVSASWWLRRWPSSAEHQPDF